MSLYSYFSLFRPYVFRSINLRISFSSLANVGLLLGSYSQHFSITSYTGGGQFVGGGILYPFLTWEWIHSNCKIKLIEYSRLQSLVYSAHWPNHAQWTIVDARICALITGWRLSYNVWLYMRQWQIQGRIRANSPPRVPGIMKIHGVIVGRHISKGIQCYTYVYDGTLCSHAHSTSGGTSAARTTWFYARLGNKFDNEY